MNFYLLNTVLFAAIFWLFYTIVLKKETFFQINRIYLLLIPLLAIGLPLTVLGFLQFNTAEVASIGAATEYLNSIRISESSAEIASNSDPKPFWPFIFGGLYITGVCISSLIFIKQVRKLVCLKRQAKQKYYKGYKVFFSPESTEACTFLNSIFIGDKLPEEQRQLILEHEYIHCCEKHSFDLLYFHVLRIVFWFNPFIYLFQDEISLIHEFIADKKTAQKSSTSTYAENLLNAGFGIKQFSFTNSFFNRNTLKNRILMLHKVTSNPVKKFKVLAVIPLVFVLLTYVACSEEEQQEEAEHAVTEKTAMSDDYKDAAIPFQKVTHSPEFLDAPEFVDNEEAKEHFSTNIQKFVNHEFRTEEGAKVVDSGIVRISTEFKVNQEGKIVDVKSRAEHEELEQEAKRVVEKLPQVKPGESDGKPVDVVFQLPIVFQVNNDE